MLDKRCSENRLINTNHSYKLQEYDLRCLREGWEGQPLLDACRQSQWQDQQLPIRLEYLG